MRFKLYLFLNLLFFAFGVMPADAQNGLTISAGSSIVISGGTVFTLDSLSLTPSASWIINGANAETRDAVITHPSANPHIQQVYHFLNTLPSFSGDISFRYQDAELNGIPENQLVLNVNNGISWNAYSLNTTRDATNNIISVTGLTGIMMNELTMANLSAPLPITFISINASCLNNGENISWATAQEFESKNFIVERSMDGSSWQDIGSVLAAGNSNGVRNYTFSDNTSYGVAFYRVAESDQDGRRMISAIVKTSCAVTEAFAIHPNPVRDIMFIGITTSETAAVLLRLFDAGGSLIKQVQANLHPGVNELQLNMSGLSAGIYMLDTQWKNNTKITKIVKE